MNSYAILQKYIDKEVNLFVELSNSPRQIRGKLLDHTSGYILQTDSGIRVFNKIAGVELAGLPEGFFTVPTLNWKVFS